jgi:transcriptional regulator with XRE-family HTH domain
MQTTPVRCPSGSEVDGKAVRKLRKRRGYSITRLAPLVPMSIGYLSQIECGRKRTMGPEKFNKLADLLGVADEPEKIQPGTAA